MESRDYLQKQMDQLGRVLGKILADILHIKTQGNISDSLEIVNENLRSGVNLDLTEVCEIPQERLIEWLIQKFEMNNLHLQEFANILLEIANDLPESEVKIDLLEKTLLIYQFINYSKSIYSLEREMKIEHLKRSLDKK